MKYKIVFFMFSFGGGGAERTILNIINNLNKDIFNVTLIIGKRKENDYLYSLSNEVKIRVLNCDRLRYCLLKLRKAIIEEKPDLLFTTLIENNIMLLIARAIAFKKIPTIVREASNRSQSGKVTLIDKIITMFFYNFISKKVVALSEGVKQDLIKYFHIKRSKIKVIYNPIEVKNIKIEAQEPIEEIPDKKNKKTIITVGRLVEAKDYETLLTALWFILKKENVQLLILGEGPMKEQLVNKVKELNIEEFVHFLGFKKNPYKYINNSDVFVLSSKWEGFSHVIAESMAVGTPVISTNCKSGPPEIIVNNKYGILVPKKSPEILSYKVIELLRDIKLSQKYTEQGLKRANDFDAKKIIKDYENMFNEVLLDKSSIHRN